MVNEFDWTEDINQLNANTSMASNKSMKYEPILTDGIFTEVRSLVTKIWNTPDIIGTDDEFGYVTEKMETVNSLPQTWGSIIQMIRMFHVLIQREIIFVHLSKETNEAIKLEMYDRGWSNKDF
jgi:hypothetical protein